MDNLLMVHVFHNLRRGMLLLAGFLCSAAASHADDRDADFVTVHMPVTDQTRGMLNAAAFAKMRPKVCIVNCARGEIVVENDLLAALDSGALAGFAGNVSGCVM